MLFGPVFTREVVIAPRRTRIYIARSAYAAALLLLVCTAWLVLTGTQIVRDVSDLAQFAGLVFQILAPLQLALAVFFSAMLAATRGGPGKGPADLRPALADEPFQPGTRAGETPGQLAARAGDVRRRAAGLRSLVAAGRNFGRTDRPHGGGHGGQYYRLRQPGLDAGTLAGKDLSGPGPLRADPRPLAGPGRDARGRGPGTRRPPA